MPLTYPGGGDTLTFVRGHEDEGKTRTAVDWTSLSRLDGTIVCYAGPDQVLHMLSALLSHGRPPEDSAAVIYNGTLPTQQTIAGSLGDIAHKVKEADDRRAAILVVGRVVALREHLRWFDARPLFGKRVLVTRPREQAAEFVDLLEALGAEAIETPLVRIVPPEDYGPLDGPAPSVASLRLDRLLERERRRRLHERLIASPLDLRALSGVPAVRRRTGHRRTAGRPRA